MTKITYNKAERSATIAVSAEAWRQRLALKAEASALENKIKALEKEIGLPSASELQAQLELLPEEKATVIVTDGNGDTQGKGSVFFFGGSTTPPGWRSRIS